MKKLMVLGIALITCLAINVNIAMAADNGTEFGVDDDLWVGGTQGNWADSDVEIKGFSIFGDTNSWTLAQQKISASSGSVVITGNLQVAGTSYIEGITIATASVVGSTVTTKLQFQTSGTDGYFLKTDANGNVLLVSAATAVQGDNLGNHTATQLLNMSNKPIVNVSSMVFSNSALAISSGSVYFGGSDAGITISTNVEVSGSIRVTGKFFGDGSGLTGTGDNLGNHIATKTLDMAGYDITRIKELSIGSSGNIKISSATTQFGGAGAGVYISTNAEIVGQLYVGTTTINGSLTIGNAAAAGSETLTINPNTVKLGSVPSGSAGKQSYTTSDGITEIAFFRRK